MGIPPKKRKEAIFKTVMIENFSTKPQIWEAWRYEV